MLLNLIKCSWIWKMSIKCKRVSRISIFLATQEMLGNLGKSSLVQKKCSQNSKIVLITQKSSKLSKLKNCTRFQFFVHVVRKILLPNLLGIFQNCSPFQNLFSSFKKCLGIEKNIPAFQICSQIQ